MSNLRIYDPLSIEPVGDLFQGMLRAFRSGPEAGGFAFKVDVTESDKAYNLVAEIPGAKKEDIDVSVDRGTVMISAKVERSSEQKDGERVIRRERYSGAMQRAFTLDSAIDESKVDASYEDGVLRVVLPKKEASPQQRVTIR
ncbi:Hsp20/alpha crystallin family protein [Cupriavidus basilensis]|uniref:Hsp20/alpha crystallin family protein n=1 Tax=Cupriavidus basilensis TaxID=68895 RepID=UPI0007511F88|nr:Hsp20/alpha crystallin family protein [Cupriavidus basilensis]